MVKIDNILVPVDFSACSKAALEYAVHFGNNLDAKQVDVLHVWKPPRFIAPDQKVHGADGKEQSLVEFAKSAAGVKMKEFLAEIESGGRYEVHGRLESGVPYQTILEVAKTGAYDLVIMFFIAQFICAFSQSNLGVLLALKGAAALPSVLTIVGMILLTDLLNLFVDSASAKWALLAPIFVPMLMELGTRTTPGVAGRL